MSTIRKLSDKSKMAIVALQREGENNLCADCCKRDPKFACLKKGLFLCDHCSQVHTSFGSMVSRIKSLDFGNWNDETLQVL
ncbi:ARF GAP with effector function(s) [Desmophyllum pertusum]|uniref:ARF GAP with effector function(S) n=1 Tax=Desmophyllum pertusum TaxID=174260 RepID=A0A9W9Z789_9CNID|nr:ARF GAP with effector function(s) [Desmophyllum pertusum]KAJ7376412.1 ARF GAP with effector function(s) [Desmophyllum pertusum]